MSSKTYAITLNGVRYIMTAEEILNISEVVTGINPTTAEYTGSAINVSPISEKVLVEGTDYSITYSDNISVGICAVTISGLNSYTGSVTYYLQITEPTPVPTTDISDVVTEINPSTAEYTGEPITVVPVSDAILTEGVDYSIEYTDNVSVGECIVTISGLGNYSGTAEFILEITAVNNSGDETPEEEPENTENDDSSDSESSGDTESDDSTDTNSETTDETGDSDEETP
jgi:hypothetical protein